MSHAGSCSEIKGMRNLHGLYRMLLGCAVIGSVALLAVSADTLTDVGVWLGLVGSGTVVPVLLRGTRAFAAGMALGLAGYFYYVTTRRSWGENTWRTSALRSMALFVTIVAPTLSFAYGEGWYERPPQLDAMLSPPSELQSLRERVPNYEYRVGVILSSDLGQDREVGFGAKRGHPDDKPVPVGIRSRNVGLPPRERAARVLASS